MVPFYIGIPPWAYYPPLEIVDKSESEVIGVQLYIDGPLDIY